MQRGLQSCSLCIFLLCFVQSCAAFAMWLAGLRVVQDTLRNKGLRLERFLSKVADRNAVKQLLFLRSLEANVRRNYCASTTGPDEGLT